MICEGLRQAPACRPTATPSTRQAGDGSGMLYVAECDLGRGVFAKRAIRNGEIILVFGGALIDFVETKRRGFCGFNLPPGQPRPTIQGMFDTITAELATATDKLAHLRRFL